MGRTRTDLSLLRAPAHLATDGGGVGLAVLTSRHASVACKALRGERQAARTHRALSVSPLRRRRRRRAGASEESCGGFGNCGDANEDESRLPYQTVILSAAAQS